MNRSIRSRRKSPKRRATLAMETLESRRLLASDLVEAPQLAATADEAVQVSNRASDTSQITIARASHHDLGAVTGNRLVSGVLNNSDAYDILKFKVATKAQFKLTLSKLSLKRRPLSDK